MLFCRKVHIDKLASRFLCVEAGLPPVYSVYVGFALDTPLTVSAAELSDVCKHKFRLDKESPGLWKSVLGNLDVL